MRVSRLAALMGMTAVVLLSGPLVPVSHADSDGYYCWTDRYLAYELRLSQPPHTLHVVRFGLPGGISPAQTVTLEDFQVHGMRCLADRVEVVSWDQRHTIDVADEPRVVKTEAITAAERGAPDLAVPSFFLGDGGVGITTLASHPSGDQFLLVVSVVSQVVEEGGVDHFRSSHLVWTGPGRGERQVLELPAAYSFEPVH